MADHTKPFDPKRPNVSDPANSFIKRQKKSKNSSSNNVIDSVIKDDIFKLDIVTRATIQDTKDNTVTSSYRDNATDKWEEADLNSAERRTRGKMTGGG